jgi:heterodisulfide reductase subunit D
MKEFKRTFLKDFLNDWTLCATQCGSCYYHGPIVPHNWLELPPPEWSPPSDKCPSYEYFKFRAYTAVGRGDLASNILEDKGYPITEDLIEVMYTCTGCGMCSEICYKLRPLTAIFAIREELVQRGVNIPEPLQKIDSNIDTLNNMFGAKKAPEIVKGVPAAGEDLYFGGCVARFQEPEVVKATIEILKAGGIDIAYLGEKEQCCALIPGHDGNTAILEKKAAQNIESFQKAGAKRIIVSCAHCYKTLKVDYKLIAGELPFEVVHVAELFSQLVDEKKIAFTNPIKKKITYHDPCFLGRYCHVLDEPRKVLKSIPGLDLVEMEPHGKWSHCCGSGTKITSSCYPEFTAATTKKRLLEGKKAAHTLVTACTTCFSHMDKAVKKEEIELEIYDLPALVAKAVGIKL